MSTEKESKRERERESARARVMARVIYSRGAGDLFQRETEHLYLRPPFTELAEEK